MKIRLSIVVGVAFLILTGALAWTTARNHSAVAAGDTGTNTLTLRVQTVPPTAAAPMAVQSPGLSDRRIETNTTALDKSKTGGDKMENRQAVIDANPSLQCDPDRVIAGKTYQIPTTAPAPAVAAHPPITEADATEVVHQLKYTARKGDTVSTLAAALLGGDTKENRDAIISANASLQKDPDRLIEGQTYRIPTRASQPLAAAPTSAVPAAPRPTTQPDADRIVQQGSARQLRYTAQPGDTVSTLAAALLGSDTKENREAIINSNESLKQQPDHVVAGQSYWIPAPAPSQP